MPLLRPVASIACSMDFNTFSERGLFTVILGPTTRPVGLAANGPLYNFTSPKPGITKGISLPALLSILLPPFAQAKCSCIA